MSIQKPLQRARHLHRKLVQAHRDHLNERVVVHHRRVVQDAWRGAR